jgi:hypothetical protein
MPPQKYEVPQQSVGDTAHALARGLISSIPVIGSVQVEMFAQLVASPLENRRDKWMESVGEGLIALEKTVEGFKPENLSKNQAFMTVAVLAGRAAVATHQKEKLEALRNAVLNVAIGTPVDEEWQLLFVSWIDQFGPWHLKILALFDDPEARVRLSDVLFPNTKREEMCREKILLAAFPQLKGKQQLYRLLVMELHRLGLLENNNLQDPLHDEIFRRMTTDTGRDFLAFIKTPEKLGGST